MIYRLSCTTMLSFLLVIVQTSILPCFFYFPDNCDLLTTFIIHLSVHRAFKEFKELTFVALISGLIMDTITGDVLGVYPSLYIWIVLISKITTGYIHSDSQFSKFVIVTILITFINLIIPLLEYCVLLKGELKSVIFILKVQADLLLLDVIWGIFVIVMFTIVFHFVLMMSGKNMKRV